ncbi:hypothetical protein KKE03_04865 [Patescibacteria group bacterium]|nr:hypothetical protein [Patescibacteria group bacterium]
MGEFLEFFKTKKNLTSLLLLGILILGLPIGIELLKQQQIIKSGAETQDPIQFIKSDTEFESSGAWVTTDPNITFNITSPLGPQGGASPAPTVTVTQAPTVTAAPTVTVTQAPTVTAVPTVAPVESEPLRIDLKTGWNLISIPRPLANPSVSAFTGLEIADRIYYWNTSTKGWDYAVKSGVSWSGTVNNLEPGKGYWVRATQAGQWMVMLRKPDSNNTTVPKYSLSPGWNMVGYTNYKNNEQSLLKDYMVGIGAGNWTKAYRFNTNTQVYDIPFASNSADNQGFALMEAGRGYWVEKDTGLGTSGAVPQTP